ncbi:MAG: formyltransferase family protein [Deltaproteobacteria bacterium]
MKVLILGITPSPLTPVLETFGCRVVELEGYVDVDFIRKHSIDFAVSYRYRHLIAGSVIEYLDGKVINLHISLLPWNRGADPNLWSFLENTPKGVSIHYVDEGLDTGDIIAQKEITFEASNATLSSTYKRLNDELLGLFRQEWPLISKGKSSRCKQASGGSYHSSKDRRSFEYLIEERGWDTPVSALTGKAVARTRR